MPYDSYNTDTRQQANTWWWIPPGEPFTVDNRIIEDGMVYVGERLQAAKHYLTEPALINPSLDINWRRPDRAGSSMTYYPAYSEISPGARAAFLEWLIDGRKNPSAYIGYVFLFFYGLERRLLFDLKSDIQHQTSDTIRHEIQRLRTLYADNNSFNRYSTNLLCYIQDLQFVQSLPVKDQTRNELQKTLRKYLTGNNYSLFGIKFFIALYTGLQQSIPPQLLLAYYRYSNGFTKSSIVNKCSAEFNELFILRCWERYTTGYVFADNNYPLTAKYNPASNGLNAATRTFSKLFDVEFALQDNANIQKLADDCVEELRKYSRRKGQTSNTTANIALQSLLPARLLQKRYRKPARALHSYIAHGRDPQHSPATLAFLVNMLNTHSQTKFKLPETNTNKVLLVLLSFLQKLSIGIEPDIRFGSKDVQFDEPLVIFQIDHAAPSTPSAKYKTALSTAHLIAIVNRALGTANEPSQLVKSAWRGQGEIAEHHKTRLEAHLRYYISSCLYEEHSLKRTVTALSTTNQQAIGKAILGVATKEIDGIVTTTHDLKTIYSSIGLPEDWLPRELREFAAPTIATSVAIALPAPEILEPQVVIDPEKLRITQEETEIVASLLATVFTEDESIFDLDVDINTDISVLTPITSDGSSESVIQITGLDTKHSALVGKLIEQMEWERAEVQILAAAIGIPLLDGALDMINEAIIDICDEPLFEGANPIIVNAYALEEIQ